LDRIGVFQVAMASGWLLASAPFDALSGYATAGGTRFNSTR